MKARTGLAALVLGAAASTGCYDFGAPIDPEPRHELDPALLGAWRCLPAQPTPASEATDLVFAPGARDRVYAISSREPGHRENGLEGYASEIYGQPVLNVRDPEASREPWMFLRYAFLLPDVLRLEVVDDRALDGVPQDPASLRAALERLDGQPDVYEELSVCVRVKTEGAE